MPPDPPLPDLFTHCATPTRTTAYAAPLCAPRYSRPGTAQRMIFAALATPGAPGSSAGERPCQAGLAGRQPVRRVRVSAAAACTACRQWLPSDCHRAETGRRAPCGGCSPVCSFVRVQVRSGRSARPNQGDSRRAGTISRSLGAWACWPGAKRYPAWFPGRRGRLVTKLVTVRSELW
jgi:hypothetical protein